MDQITNAVSNTISAAGGVARRIRSEVMAEKWRVGAVGLLVGVAVGRWLHKRGY